MITLVSLPLLGFVAAVALGGTLHGWRTVRVRCWLLALMALGLQLFIYNPPIDSQPWAIVWGPLLFVLAKAILLAVLLANALGAHAAALRGAWLLAALGVGLNLAVVAANGGYMPQSSEARMLVRGATLLEGETVPRLRNVKPIDESTRLVWLADVIPQPTWMPRANVMSIGDVLLAGGLGLWAFQLTRQVRRATVRRLAVADS